MKENNENINMNSIYREKILIWGTLKFQVSPLVHVLRHNKGIDNFMYIKSKCKGK